MKDAIMTAIIDYLIRVGDAVSQLLNVVFLFSQNPNESISGRCYRMRHKKQWQIALGQTKKLAKSVAAWVYVTQSYSRLSSQRFKGN